MYFTYKHIRKVYCANLVLFAVLRAVQGQGQSKALRMRNKHIQKWKTKTCIYDIKTKVNNNNNTCILLLYISKVNIYVKHIKQN